MRYLSSALFASLLSALGGCAIQPLPEHVTGVNTYNITRQIRCEAREAIIRAVGNWLTRVENVSKKSRDVGLKILNDDVAWDSFSPSMLGHAEQDVLELFWNTGIAYDFVLQAEETN